jgi:pimeloyl-ACP methyl ester carboxylesterase
MSSESGALLDAPGVTHGFVTVRGARFHYTQSGAASADDDAVLLLHGLPLHSYSWRHVLAQLAGEYRLICLDLRGCGGSEATRRGYATRDQVKDVVGVMDALGLRRVRLLGHESGGWLGFLLCLAAPERFSAFLGLNTSHPWLERKGGVPWSAWRFWYTAFWEYPGVGRRVLRHWPGFTRSLLRSWAGRAHHWDEAALEEFVRASRGKEQSRVIEQNLWQFVIHDIPRLATRRMDRERLDVPTLILTGDRDPVTRLRPMPALPEHASRLEVRVVPGGHLLPETAPDAVAAAAREWFGLSRNADGP